MLLVSMYQIMTEKIATEQENLETTKKKNNCQIHQQKLLKTFYITERN